MAEHYAAAGVSLEAGYKSVELIKEHVKKTMRPEVLGGFGGFSGAFSLSKIKDMEEPVLLSGTDGCGTKVKLAMVMDKHDTIGIDAVAMCVNDIACAGGEPLFFLDYIACGKNVPEKIADIVKGVSEGCLQSEAALIGGETAEHPGLMPEDDYDLAGFAVGVCDKKDMITGKNLNVGDVLIGLPSTGVHSNGFSLVRNVFDITEESLNTYYDELGKTLGEALLAPTKIYVKKFVASDNDGKNPDFGKIEVKTTENQKSGLRQKRNQDFGFSECNKTENNKLEINKGIDNTDKIDEIRQKVHAQIEYDILAQEYSESALNEIAELMLEVYCTEAKTLKIGRRNIPVALAKERLQMLNSAHIEYIFESLRASPANIKNIKAYLLECLFNAPATMKHYYQAKVNYHANATNA